jgi:hypothetical protein
MEKIKATTFAEASVVKAGDGRRVEDADNRRFVMGDGKKSCSHVVLRSGRRM